jgi:hypothetical protein
MNVDSLKTLAQDLPESHKQNALDLLERMGEVIEGIGDKPQTWRPPLLRLVQGTTDRSSIPKGTAIGDMLIGETKLEQPFKIIPIRTWDGRQFWSPDPNESKLECWSLDGKLGWIGMYCNQCPHKVFNEETRKSDCGKTKNILAMTSDFSDLVQITFSKTNYAVGMDIEAAMKKAGVAPYKRTYGLSSATNSKFKNVENFALELLGDKDKVTDDALVPFLKELFNVVNTDRKESLDKFYEIVLERKDTVTALLPSSESSADSNLKLEDDTATDVEASTVSELSKNYQV